MAAPDEPSKSSRPVYQTDLAQTPLPEILATVHRYKAPGTIECRRGNELKEIYLDQGQIIFATSNQIRDSLGDKLLRDGKITQEQYDESVRRLVSTRKRQGTILTEMNVIAAGDLFAALREQILEIVWSVFAWDAGTVAFTPGRHKQQEFVKIDIPIPQAVLQGARRIPDAKPLMGRLGSKSTLLTRTDKPADGLTLDLDEQRLLDAANGKTALYDIVNLPPLGAGMNARILYAFVVMQLLTAKATERVTVKVGTDGDSYTGG
ncbi:MAG TPA: DUF4388 domain-containing protein [Thermoanaerobaculia bacterium]